VSLDPGSSFAEKSAGAAGWRKEVLVAAGNAEGNAHAGEPIQLCAAAATVAVEESGEAAHGHVIVHQQLLVLGEVASSGADLTVAKVQLESEEEKGLAAKVKSTGVSGDRVLRVTAHLGKAVGSEDLVAGQVVDIASEEDLAVGLETLEYVHTHKTAVLLESAVVSGAFLGRASEDKISRLSKYVVSVGLLFQVVDDILDVTKSSAELGKTAGKDLLADKATYPKLLGLEKANKSGKNLEEKTEAARKEASARVDAAKAQGEYTVDSE
jgi:hypothetical protein